MNQNNTFNRDFPSIHELMNLFEVSFTIYNYLEQAFEFYNDDENSPFFNYFGKSLNYLPIKALEDLEIILLFLPFNYIDAFVDLINSKLKLNFTYSTEFQNIKFIVDNKKEIYFLLSNTYYSLIQNLKQKIKFNPKVFFPIGFYSDDRMLRYNEFLANFK